MQMFNGEVDCPEHLQMVRPSLLGGYFTKPFKESRTTTTYPRCCRAVFAGIHSTMPMDIPGRDGAVSRGGIGHQGQPEYSLSAPAKE